MFSIGAEDSPSPHKSFNIFSFQRKYFIFIFRGFDIIEVLINNCDENIKKDVMCNDLKSQPINNCYNASLIITIMHNSIPVFTSRSSEQKHNGNIEGSEVGIITNVLRIIHRSKQIHTCHSKSKEY